jgi:hypothetical protein
VIAKIKLFAGRRQRPSVDADRNFDGAQAVEASPCHA